MSTVETSPRPRTHELLKLPPQPAPAAPVKQLLPPPMRWADGSVEDLVQAVRAHCWTAGVGRGAVKPQTSLPMQGAQIVLDYLATLPGDTWNDRWSLVDAQTAGGEDWRELMRPGDSRYARSMMTYGLGVLLVMDVIRPSYAWQQGRMLNIFNIVGEPRDPEGMRVVGPKIDQLGNPAIAKQVRQSLGKIQLHTGKSMRQITAEDLLDLNAALAELPILSHYRKAVEHLWRVLTELGWITHDSIAWPAHRVRKPQLNPAELVDHYGISGPQREVLIEYLKQRRAAPRWTTRPTGPPPPSCSRTSGPTSPSTTRTCRASPSPENRPTAGSSACGPKATARTESIPLTRCSWSARSTRLSRVSWKLRWRSPARRLPCGRCWESAKTTHEQGTVVTKKYQKIEFDTSKLAVPEQVSVAMEEIAADLREGLLALAVGAGLQVMAQLMEADVTARCGPRGKQDPDRAATRHGTESGSVTLGGRRVPLVRPRVRAVDGSGEVPVPAYELFSSTELMGRMALERMLAGVSTRRYPVALEPVGAQVEADQKSTSKSAVSRKFVAMTESALADLLAADLSGLDLLR